MAVAVGLPGGPGGGECRLEVGEFGGGLGATAGSVVEVVDDILTLLLEPGPPWADPVGNDRRRLGSSGMGGSRLGGRGLVAG